MANTLIVFYSYTGNASRVAHLLAAQRGWAIGEILERNPRSSRGYLKCVLDSVFHRRPVIDYHGPQPADFQTVVLVAPVWVGQLAAPMRSFVAQHRHQIRRAAVIMTMGGQGASNAVAEIGRILGRDPVASEVVLARAAEDGSCAQALDAFGAVVERGPAGKPIRPAEWSPVAG